MSAESMDCNELVELVTAYLEGALDLDTRARFDIHLTECDGCDNYLQQLQTTVDTLGRVDSGELDPAFRDRLLAAFREWK
ncbi:anti-sigma factor family protein [Mycobacterium sp. NPDC003323]